MNDLNVARSDKLNLDRPPAVDLSERIWNLHRIITDPTVKWAELQDAKRSLLGALIVQNELRNILVPPISKRARASSSSSSRANHSRQLPLNGAARWRRTSNAQHRLFAVKGVLS